MSRARSPRDWRLQSRRPAEAGVVGELKPIEIGADVATSAGQSSGCLLALPAAGTIFPAISMCMAGRQKIVRLVVAVAVWGFFGGCADMPRRPGAAGRSTDSDSDRLLRSLRYAQDQGWRAVGDAERVLQNESGSRFPGVDALTERLRLLAAQTSAGKNVPDFKPGQLVDHNPDFWRALFETAPVQPSLGLLHVGLLLAAGDAARAHNVATLWINFGRMSVAHREEFIGLDVYAQGVVQVARRHRMERGRPKQSTAFAAQVQAAESELSVWPQNPDALTKLVDTIWSEEGKPKQIVPGSRLALIATELRKVDPMCRAFALMPVICSPDLRRARRLWMQISSGNNAGDLQLLRRFSNDAQVAQLDDLALCARSLLADWEPGSRLPDEVFVRASLRRLVGESVSDGVCSEIYQHNRERIEVAVEDRAPLAGHPGPVVQPQLEQQMLVRIAEYTFWIDHGRLRGPALAAKYVGRGQAWIGLGRLRQGVGDLRHALRINPNDDHANWNLAAALGKSGNFSTANALFAGALKRTPANVGVAVGWANDLFMEQRWKEAAAAYERATHMDPTYAFPWLMVGLARRRAKLPAGIVPDDWKAARDPWTADLASYVAGTIDRTALRGRMEPQGVLQQSVDKCKLNFVEGELALSQGDLASARRHFDNCLATGVTNYIEYYMALLELGRLNSAASSLDRRVASPNSESA